jgi:hypothetical protein
MQVRVTHVTRLVSKHESVHTLCNAHAKLELHDLACVYLSCGSKTRESDNIFNIPENLCITDMNYKVMRLPQHQLSFFRTQLSFILCAKQIPTRRVQGNQSSCLYKHTLSMGTSQHQIRTSQWSIFPGSTDVVYYVRDLDPAAGERHVQSNMRYKACHLRKQLRFKYR